MNTITATLTLAKRAAINATKRQLKAQGLTRPLPPRDILPLANQYLTAHREELLAEAKAVVERWTAEGFFGKRARAAVHKTTEL